MENQNGQRPDYGSNAGASARFFAWPLFVFSLLANSSLLSLIIFSVTRSGWDVSRYYSDTSFDFFLSTFPFLGLTAFLAFFALSVLVFQFTGTRHRTSIYNSIFMILFASIFLGFISFYSNAAEKADDLLSDYPLYPLLVGDRNKVWEAPEQGLLSGEIGTITEPNDFLLVDFKGKTWRIISNDPLIPDKSIIRTGNNIKLIGRKIQESNFEAKEIRPF